MTKNYCVFYTINHILPMPYFLLKVETNFHCKEVFKAAYLALRLCRRLFSMHMIGGYICRMLWESIIIIIDSRQQSDKVMQ